MSFGRLFCIVMVGAIIYLVGVFSGAAMVEKSNEVYAEQANQKAERIRKERKHRYEMRHLKAEA